MGENETKRRAVDVPDEPDEVAAKRAYGRIRPLYGLAAWDSLSATERAAWTAMVSEARFPIVASRDLWRSGARHAVESVRDASEARGFARARERAARLVESADDGVPLQMLADESIRAMTDERAEDAS